MNLNDCLVIIPVITDEIGSHIDIDYEEDLKMAEIILNHYLE